MDVELLPHCNAALNTAAAILLFWGWRLIKARREGAHRNAMLGAFAVSCVFLACYLYYHYHVPSKKFPSGPGAPPDAIRYAYYALLASHVVLAVTVPFLAGTTIYLALRDQRAAHRRLAKVTFPIWMYVSVTGIIVYVMLYQLYG